MMRWKLRCFIVWLMMNERLMGAEAVPLLTLSLFLTEAVPLLTLSLF